MIVLHPLFGRKMNLNMSFFNLSKPSCDSSVTAADMRSASKPNRDGTRLSSVELDLEIMCLNVDGVTSEGF